MACDTLKNNLANFDLEMNMEILDPNNVEEVGDDKKVISIFHNDFADG